MGLFIRVLLPLAVAYGVQDALAETYKCVRGGQTVYSDISCASGAARVDDQADKVSRERQRQAEAVNSANRRQLSELEYQAARDRYIPRTVVTLQR